MNPARTAILPTALALLIGIALGFGAARFTSASPGEGSPEVTFARDMSAHHAQAVQMALVARDRFSDSTLLVNSQDIILTQQAQIGMMSGWLEQWGRPQAGSEAPMEGMQEGMGMASETDVNALQTLPENEAEVSFLRLMIRLHQGGVAMAENVIAETKRPEVRRLAETIIAGQSSEIKAMTDLLAERNAEPMPPLEPMQHGSDHDK